MFRCCTKSEKTNFKNYKYAKAQHTLGYFSSLELGNQLVMLFLFYHERFYFKNPLKIFLYIIYINFSFVVFIICYNIYSC